jgi:hypothetical protein
LIKEIKTSCGCTHALIGQQNIEPGESSFVEANFDPTGNIGNVHKYLEVISNDPANPNTRLTFEAGVTREIMPSSTVITFSDVKRDSSTTSSIRLKSWNDQPVAVTDIKIPDAPYLSCNTQMDGNDAILDVAINGGLVPKQNQRGEDTLTVYIASNSTPTMQFNVQWSIAAAIVTTPGRVLWNDTAGKELRKTIHLKTISGKKFRILKADSSAPFIKADNIKKRSAEEQTFDIVLSPKAKAGGYREKLTLTLDDQDQQTVEISISLLLR